MSDASKGQCIFCGKVAATFQETDHGNCVYIACQSEGCGRYEISHRAMKHAAKDKERMALLRGFVAQHSSEHCHVNIVIGTDGNLVATPIRDADAPVPAVAANNDSEASGWHLTDVVHVDDALIEDLTKRGPL